MQTATCLIIGCLIWSMGFGLVPKDWADRIDPEILREGIADALRKNDTAGEAKDDLFQGDIKLDSVLEQAGGATGEPSKPALANATDSNFEPDLLGNMTSEASQSDGCKTLNRCHPFYSLDPARVFEECTDAVFIYLDLVIACTPADGRSIISKTKALNISRLFYVSVDDEATGTGLLDPIRDEAGAISVHKCMDYNVTSRLPTLGLVNLRFYTLSDCTQLHVKKADFSGSAKLRMIIFYNVTFADIEKATFTDLPELKHLALEYYLRRGDLGNAESTASAVMLHCSCDYLWLRKWMNKNPSIVSPKTSADTYDMNVPFFESRYADPLDLFEIFVPMNCASRSVDLIQNQNQHSPANFTINDPCIS